MDTFCTTSPSLRWWHLCQVVRSAGTADAKKLCWRRPTEFLDGEFGVFEHDVSADDIVQGQLGNCWFMSALGALTEYPLLVDHLFVDKWRRVCAGTRQENTLRLIHCCLIHCYLDPRAAVRANSRCFTSLLGDTGELHALLMFPVLTDRTKEGPSDGPKDER